MSMITFDNTYSKLPNDFFSHTTPSKFIHSKLLAVNYELCEHLGIQTDPFSEFKSIFSGVKTPSSAANISLAYAGHQFGNFVPRLGDGRAILLGEILAKNGERYDLQFKGSGPTLFSRGGDGKYPLGPAMREFILSEAMFHLGVPTSRCLAIFNTGEQLLRTRKLSGGLVTRVASSHIRIGTFEYFAHSKDIDHLKILLNYSIKRHYPEINGEYEVNFFHEVVKNQAKLIAKWMSIGFIHGVMNTDNVAISGETLDYGPCAFLDDYNSSKVFSSIDHFGRYAYNNQAAIGYWNCSKLLECLSLLLSSQGLSGHEILQPILDLFPKYYEEYWLKHMEKKLGFASSSNEFKHLIEKFLHCLEAEKLDYTQSFSNLYHCLKEDWQAYFPKTFHSFFKNWFEVIRSPHNDDRHSIHLLKSHNPIYIPRNHQIEKIIHEAYQGNYKSFKLFYDLVKDPFEKKSHGDPFEKPPLDSQKVIHTFCGT